MLVPRGELRSGPVDLAGVQYQVAWCKRYVLSDSTGCNCRRYAETIDEIRPRYPPKKVGSEVNESEPLSLSEVQRLAS